MTRHHKQNPLRQIQWKAHRAATNWNLVAIAGYARSPEFAYDEAWDYGWGRQACLSVKSLASIYFRYGQDSFVKTVEKLAPSIFDDLCLCECHHGLQEEDNSCECCDTYGTSCFCYCHFCQYCDTESQNCLGDDSCGCDCHDNNDCCHDCDTSCWCQCHSCLYCNSDDVCSGSCSCDCHPSCDDCEVRHGDEQQQEDEDTDCVCDCHDCSDCYSACFDGCECDCHECCDECSDDDDNDDYEQPESVYMSKIDRVIDQIRQAAGVNFVLEQTDHIDGDRMQAVAYRDGRVKVTHELINRMTEDELAFVVAHEVAHIEKEHGKKLETLVNTELETLRAGLRKADQSLKEKGAGFIKRAATQFLGGAIGGAGVVVTSRLSSQRHETEADERAMEIVREAGFSEEASVSALEKLHGGSVPELGIVQTIMSTHPAPRRRHKQLKDKSKR